MFLLFLMLHHKISKLSRIIDILAYSWAKMTLQIYIFLFNPDPEWSEWSSYGPCSSTCGQGFQTRRRTCLESFGTQDCQGKSSESKGCNSQLCVKGGCWSILNCEFNLYYHLYLHPCDCDFFSSPVEDALGRSVKMVQWGAITRWQHWSRMIS